MSGPRGLLSTPLGRGNRPPSAPRAPGLRGSPRGRDKLELPGGVREALRPRHYSGGTQEINCQWVERFIYLHNLRHPAEMARPEINPFPSRLSVKEKVAA
jgi:hypothetical protein